MESRCDQLYRLKKKYGATVEDMLAYLDRCRRELDAIETADEHAGPPGAEACHSRGEGPRGGRRL